MKFKAVAAEFIINITVCSVMFTLVDKPMTSFASSFLGVSL
jgi:hypothetical protein